MPARSYASVVRARLSTLASQTATGRPTSSTTTKSVTRTLRDRNAELAARGAAVLGVSTQGVESHRAFTEKHKLNFPLLVDSEGKAGRAYGTLGGAGLISKLKSAVGMADRVTFVIDGTGRIVHVVDKPDVARHGEELLALL